MTGERQNLFSRPDAAEIQFDVGARRIDMKSRCSDRVCHYGSSGI